DGIEFLLKTFQNRLPFVVLGHAPSRLAANAMFTIQVYIEWTFRMAPYTQRDTDRVLGCHRVLLRLAGLGLGFGFVELKADLREVVELGYVDVREVRVGGDEFCRNTTLDDAIEKGIDM